MSGCWHSFRCRPPDIVISILLFFYGYTTVIGVIAILGIGDDDSLARTPCADDSPVGYCSDPTVKTQEKGSFVFRFPGTGPGPETYGLSSLQSKLSPV